MSLASEPDPSRSTPFFQDDVVTLHHGDCIDILRTLPDSSVDSVVTDPPYGLEFMGKDWDAPWKASSIGRGVNVASERASEVTAQGTGHSTSAGPYLAARVDSVRVAGKPFQDWCTEWATECLRVLKPGGYMVAFGGSRTWHRLAGAVEDSGFEIRDSIAWLYGSGFPKSLNLPGGLGTALKPAFEPIVVGRKKLVGTVAANVLAYGSGALNIDACRTETTDKLGGGAESGSTAWSAHEEWQRPWMTDPEKLAAHSARVSDNVEKAESLGRWPTNVLLDKGQADELDRQSGARAAGGSVRGDEPSSRTSAVYGEHERTPFVGHGDSGGAARFFPTFHYQAKAPSSERPNVDGVQHPTVKPLDLMRWLVRLVTPPNGVVLEPFAGSGTTIEACVHEHMTCIAIEREGAYLPLIVDRLSKAIEVGFDFGGVA